MGVEQLARFVRRQPFDAERARYRDENVANAVRRGRLGSGAGVVGAWIHPVVGFTVKDEGPALQPGGSPAASKRLQEGLAPEVLMDVDRLGGPIVNRFSDAV